MIVVDGGLHLLMSSSNFSAIEWQNATGDNADEVDIGFVQTCETFDKVGGGGCGVFSVAIS